MTDQPLASIVISSYNYARYLPAAIESALSQTYPNVEVIVVDDGSVDNSAAVIRGYRHRVVPIIKENGGQASAWNVGFRFSRGAAILFLDSDDALLPEAVEQAARLFEDASVAKVHWPLWEIDTSGRRTGKVNPPGDLPEGELRDLLARHGPDSYPTPPTSGNAWSRRFLERIFPIPEREYVTCPDGYLALLAPLFGSVRRIPTPQALYRVHGQNSMSGTFYPDKIRMFEHRCGVLKEHLAELGIAVDPDEWKRPYYAWLDQIHATAEDLAALVPADEPFVLVDENQLRGEFAAGRRARPFPEHEGQYAGPPADDDAAIAEIERLRQEGPGLVVFAWPAFWWLDHYTHMREHLESTSRCVLENERLVAFDLTR